MIRARRIEETRLSVPSCGWIESTSGKLFGRVVCCLTPSGDTGAVISILCVQSGHNAIEQRFVQKLTPKANVKVKTTKTEKKIIKFTDEFVCVLYLGLHFLFESGFLVFNLCAAV